MLINKMNSISFKKISVFATIFFGSFFYIIFLDLPEGREQFKNGSGEVYFDPSLYHMEQGQRCVDLGNNEGMDRLLSRFDLVYVVFPAKAAGSTMKTFTNECLQMDSKFVNVLGSSDFDGLFKMLQSERQVPPIISSHLYGSRSFVEVAKNSITNSLIIYIHREETSRLKAAISQVVKRQKSTKAITEADLFFLMKHPMYEIPISGTTILNCDSYQSIEDNAPNLVFLHYKQTDKLLQLLSKRHCPNYEPRRVNVNSEKQKVTVEMNNNSTMDLEEWLDNKANLLEHAFYIKNEGSCQAKTRKMQHNLFSCPDEALHYSSSDFFVPVDEMIGK